MLSVFRHKQQLATVLIIAKNVIQSAKMEKIINNFQTII